ncbi:MAG TPA: FG-GAP-like repeat-containing protein [Cyclobacteriaceae bacterium]|nr:FG-GAP-like repeat-containing protein [Cyclobacteriaceae bacterium]
MSFNHMLTNNNRPGKLLRPSYVGILLTGLFVFIVQSLFAQEVPIFQYARVAGGNPNTDRGKSVITDAGGYVYLVSEFRGTGDIDPGPAVVTKTATGTDLILVKIDPSGNTVWIKTINSATAQDIALDDSGNIFLTGGFSSTIDFDPGPGVSNLTSLGYNDAFVLKLDNDGNYIWAKSFGTTNPNDFGYSIAVDPSGNVITSGQIAGLADLDPGPGVSMVTPTGYGAFVQKLDTNGNFVWGITFSGSSNIDAARAVTTDGVGNVYVTGLFTGTSDFDPGPGTFTMTALTYSNVFVAKLTANGIFSWAKSFGGSGWDYGNSITVDQLGNVYTAGQFGGPADFDPGPGVFTLSTALGGFVSKLDNNGNFVWATAQGSGGWFTINSIALDTSGDVYTTGYFLGSADFDPGPGTFTIVPNSYDVFVSKLTSAGNFVWATSFGGPNREDGNAITIDPFDNIYTTGSYETTANFNPGACVNSFTAAGGADLFLQKMSTGIVGPPPTFSSFTPTSGYPGATVTLTGTNFSTVPGINVVRFNGVQSIVTASTATSITTTVPAGATTGPVTVEIACQTATAPGNFTVLIPPPVITAFSPVSGPIGTTVTLTGTDFGTTISNNIVYFGARRATVTSASSTSLTVVVPAGATFQPITVTRSGLTGFSQVPFITTFANGGVIDACSFSALIEYTAGTNTQDVALGDLDGDGKVDMVVTNYGTSNISVYRNTSSTGSITATSFAPKVDFALSSNSYAAAVGDVDGDGKLDIVASNYFSGTISVFRNTASPGSLTSSSFAAAVQFTAGGFPLYIGIRDFDLDGKSDIAVLNTGSNNVSVFRNIGSPGTINASSLSPKVDFAIGAFGQGLIVEDLDVDGKPDILVTVGNGVEILRNNANRGAITGTSFDAKVNFVTGSFPNYAATGDLDNDGKPDIVVSNWSNGNISVLKNISAPGSISTGSFAAKFDIATFSEPRGVAVGDLDGDGALEIAVAGQIANKVSVFKNVATAGTLDLTSFATNVDFPSSGNPRTLTMGDLDGDGRPELVMAGSSANAVGVLRNTVSTLAAPTLTSFTPAQGPPGTLVTITGTNFSTIAAQNTVKFNGTTATVVSSTSTTINVTVPSGATNGTISVSTGCNTATSSGTFTTAIGISGFSPASGPVGTTVLIDGGGFSTTPSNNVVFFGATQATVTNATSNQLTVTVPYGATYKPISVTVGGIVSNSTAPFQVTFPGGGTLDACSFAAKVDFPTGVSPNGTQLIDIDGDGKSDMVFTNTTSNTLSVARNTSTGAGVVSFAATTDFIPLAGPDGLTFGDLDGDGKQDIAIMNNNGVSIFRNTSTPGAISFATRVDIAAGLLTNGRRITAGDLDIDGKLDLIVPNNFNKVSVFKNQSTPGNISSAAKVDFAIHGASTLPWNTTVGDLDGDNKPEIVVSLISSGNRVSILRNTTTPGVINAASFAGFVQFITGSNPYDVEIADIDGDQKAEIITANLSSGSISVFRNTSTLGIINASSFATRVDYSLGGIAPNNLAINDYDGDGKPDIAIARSQSAFVTIFRNISTVGVINAGSLASKVEFNSGPALTATYDIAAGDIDNDGRPDLVLTNDKASVFLNTTGVNPVPTITSFSPAFGLPGTVVTITGTNFSTTPAANTVTFNGTPAEVTASTSTSITTSVPAGANTGLIRVAVGCPAATSSTSFYVGTCLPPAERNALFAIYYAMNGAAWTNSTNWLSQDESTWFGVTISGCHVTGLSLPNNQLNGFFPPELGDLPALVTLNLSRNNIQGGIPDQIANLTSLQTLNLEVNALSGQVTTSLGSLVQLNTLSLASNQLDGDVPESLTSLPNLSVVKLWGNFFTSIPVFDPAKITTLSVEYNSLDFGDLEPNINIAGITYVPQAPLPPGGIFNFNTGNSITVPFSTSGSSNSYQWYRASTTPVVGATSASLTLAAPTSADVDSYTVQVTSSVVPGLTLTSMPYLLFENPCPPGPRTGGALDLTFDSKNTDPTPVMAVATQSTGKSIISTTFGTFNSVDVSGIARFNSDGTLDNTFTIGTYYPNDRQLIVQPDDKILGVYSGTYSYPIRLNADGTNDVAFNSNVPQYYNSEITALELQSDGKILVSAFDPYALGNFKVRLNADGTEDISFNVTADLPATVMKAQSDGYILVGGSFLGGVTRLDPTGATDASFQIVEGADDMVTDILLQSDGKIIVIGLFTHYNDVPYRGIVRLNPDGTIDTSFNPYGISQVGSAAGLGIQPNKGFVQPDGKIVIAGYFADVNHANKISMVRLNTDGSVDCTFDTGTGPDTSIYDVAQQTDGDILIVGDFTIYDGTTRYGFARVKNSTTNTLTITQQPSDAIVCDGSTATFNALATGTTNITYQWQFSPNINPKVFTDIANGGPYAGATTNTLTVNTAGTTGAGRYRCRINGDFAVEVITNNEGLFINAPPAAPAGNPNSGCVSTSVTIGASGASNGQYRWYTIASGGTAIPGEVNSQYTTPALATTTDYYASIDNGSCESSRTAVTATILPLPAPPSTTGAISCVASSMTLTASGSTNGNYRWYAVSTGGTAIPGEVNSQYVTPVVAATTNWFVSLTNGTCESTRQAVSATIDQVAKPTIATTNCTASGATLNGPAGFSSYIWSTGGSGQSISVSSAGSYTLVVKNGNGCSSPVSDAMTFTAAFCNQSPQGTTTSLTTTIDVPVSTDLLNLFKDPDNNLDLNTFTIVAPPLSGAKASISAGILSIDYTGISFAGTDEITISVCDLAGACIQQKITIEVAGEIIVYTGISPDGNGKNDNWIIKYIDLLPDTKENHVTVYNRWGDAVFEVDNYNNTSRVFAGVGKNGSELGTGTYFYKIEFSSGRKTLTGYLSLKR